MGALVLKAIEKKGYDTLLTTQHKSLWEISAMDIEGNMKNIGEVCQGRKCVMVINVASK
jgi:hypothetical protein